MWCSQHGLRWFVDWVLGWWVRLLDSNFILEPGFHRFLIYIFVKQVLAIDHVENFELEIVQPELVGRFQFRPLECWNLLISYYFTINVVFVQSFHLFYMLIYHFFVLFLQFLIAFSLITFVLFLLIHLFTQCLFTFNLHFIYKIIIFVFIFVTLFLFLFVIDTIVIWNYMIQSTLRMVKRLEIAEWWVDFGCGKWLGISLFLRLVDFVGFKWKLLFVNSLNECLGTFLIDEAIPVSCDRLFVTLIMILAV